MIDKQCTPDQFSSIRTWYLASVSVISYQVLSHAEYSMPVSSVCVWGGGGGWTIICPIYMVGIYILVLQAGYQWEKCMTMFKVHVVTLPGYWTIDWWKSKYYPLPSPLQSQKYDFPPLVLCEELFHLFSVWLLLAVTFSLVSFFSYAILSLLSVTFSCCFSVRSSKIASLYSKAYWYRTCTIQSHLELSVNAHIKSRN